MIYTPREDSHLLEKAVLKYAKGKIFLDMGAGSGIQSLAALKSGAKRVVASEIDKISILELKKKKINVIESNLFSKVEGKFDLIAFNPPYLPYDKREDHESSLATSGGKKGDEIIVRFLDNAPNYLRKDGMILLLLSSLTPRDNVNKVIKKNGMIKRRIYKEKFFMESLEILLIKRKNQALKR